MLHLDYSPYAVNDNDMILVKQPLFRTTLITQYQIVFIPDFTGADDNGELQLSCHCKQTNAQLFTGRMPFLSPNCQLSVFPLCKTVSAKNGWPAR